MDIKKVLIIGSGAIVIGQGAEFDYSGTQACRVLKEENIEIVLLNNNPATIMTDKEMADKVYMEPLTLDFVVKIIEKERPDSIMVNVGGQTALNLGLELYENGILEKYSIKVLGTSLEDIKISESRELFYKKMVEINEPVLKSQIAFSLEESLKIADEIGYPVVVRPAYTLGGNGGGIAETKDELIEIASKGLNITSELLIEKSIKGYKEIEYEMMRDKNGNVITVCNMENIDPVGIHTGDSIVVAPSQTLTDKEYQMLRSSSINIVNSLNIVGGCNVQFALNAETSEYIVIEVNSRVSRSSALASKATGYPIAKITTMLSLGYNLDEIENDVTKKTYACFEPTLDYCTVKFPYLPFDKFRKTTNTLGTSMMATGEVMSIARNFEAALLKAIRSLESNRFTLLDKSLFKYTLDELFFKLNNPDDKRIFEIAELLRREVSKKLIHKKTKISEFFLEKIEKIVRLEKKIYNRDYKTITKEELINLKKFGFSDRGISELTLFASENDIRNLRKKYNIISSYKMVDTCSGEFDAISPYYYSSYGVIDEVEISNRKKIIVIGSGPIRIGQGIEFDYSSVHAILALKKKNIETIIINNNPETVSTDFNLSDKLYFEPITFEDVMNIIEKEKPYGVILQFGGQTAIKLSKELEESGVNILGSDYKAMHNSEDRDEFIKILEKNKILYPKGIAINKNYDLNNIYNNLKFPLLVRPSYVLGGLGMSVINKKEELNNYIESAFNNDENQTILIDEYILGIEIEVDGISDGNNIEISGIMEHIDRSGIHSGDSVLVYPSINLSDKIKNLIFENAKLVTKELGIIGLFNIQYVYANNKIYIIEVNPRSSRTVPFISKATGINLVDKAIDILLGEKLEASPNYIEKINELYYIKSPVFSTYKIKNEDIVLGPEMKSTGETISIERTFLSAFYKAMLKINIDINIAKKIYIDVEEFNIDIEELIINFLDSDIKIYINKDKEVFFKETFSLYENKMNFIDENQIIDNIKNKEFNFIISLSKLNYNDSDSKKIRRFSIENNIPTVTSIDIAKNLSLLLKEYIDISKLEVFDIIR